jgi:hypothetical protein
VREVYNLGASNPREEVLIAPGEAHYLVREDRAADDHEIVLDHQAVYAYAHFLPEHARVNILHLASRDGAQ